MATIIPASPSPWDTASQAFQRAFELSAQLHQQQQELDVRRQQVESQVELDAAQRKRLLFEIEQAQRTSAISQSALAFVQGRMQDLTDPVRFGSATSSISPELYGAVFALRDDFLKQQRDAAVLLEQERNSSAVSQAISRLPGNQQQAARDLTALTKAGLPGDVAVGLYSSLQKPPELTPYERANLDVQKRGQLDPLLRSGASVGEARRLLNLGPIPGVPDDYRLPGAAGTAGGKLTENQQKVFFHLNTMHEANAVLNSLADRGVKTDVPVQIYRELATRAGGSGVFSLGASVLAMIGNLGLTDQQRQLVNAQLRSGNAFRYLVSGQQTSDREFVLIFTYYAENAGDDDVTRAQKRAFRDAIEEAGRAIVEGRASRVQAMQELQRIAGAQGAGPGVINTLERMQVYAAREDSGNMVPVIPRDSVGSADMLDSLIRGAR